MDDHDAPFKGILDDGEDESAANELRVWTESTSRS